MMKTVLKKYQDRLNDLSRRNRAVRLSRIIKKKTFDVGSLATVDSALPMKVVEAIVKNGRSVNLVKTNIDDDKAMQSIVTHLHQLRRYVDLIEKERGSHECYLGYPFIQGNFADGTFFRCPLFLYPVTLENNPELGKIVLRPLEDSPPTLNKTFFLAFNKYNKGYRNIPIEKIEDIDLEDHNDGLDVVLDMFKAVSMKINMSEYDKNKISVFEPLRKDEHPKGMEGTIQLLSISVIGDFSQLNSSLNADYDTMLKEGYTNDLAQLVMGSPVDHDLEERFEDDKQIDHPEEDNFFITRPDVSQERVLIKSRKGKGLVIHGPPGTGKSQVITNMIADNIARGKKILVVCEKRAALDVVNNRLGAKALDRYSLLVHDAENDRNNILRRIATILNEYDAADDYDANDKVHRAVDALGKSFDEDITKLREVIDLIHDKNKFNTTLFKLYRESDPKPKLHLSLNNKFNDVTNDKLQNISENVGRLANNAYKFDNDAHPLFLRKPLNGNFDSVDYKEIIGRIQNAFAQLEKVLYSTTCKQDLKHLQQHRDIDWNVVSTIYQELQEFETHKSKKLRFVNPRWWALRKHYRTLLEEHNADELHGRWKEVHLALKDLKSYDEFLEKCFQEAFISELHTNVLAFKQNSTIFTQISNLKGEIDNISIYDTAKGRLNKTEVEILKICLEQIPPKKEDLVATWQSTIRNSFYLKWINTLETENPTIKEFSYNRYEHLKQRLIELLSRKEQLIPKLIAEQQQAIYHALKWHNYDGDGRRKNYNNLSNLLHEAQKQRRRLAMRQFVSRFKQEGLLTLFPCWLCSPETVSTMFPLQKDLFDIIIFDEASQCKLEHAIPAIVRAKRLIVAGDEHQLPPTDFFFSTTDDEEEDNEDLEEEAQQALEDESLLVRSRTVLPGQRLLYHYRSNHEPLIKFSNYAFYDSTLRIVPHNQEPKDPAIQFIRTKGIWENNSNLEEAKQVVALLKKHLRNNSEGHTFGVITFNFKQAELIEDKIEEEAADDPVFARLIQKERERYNKNEHIGLFVKNIENVQGDERDVIIFSTSYGYDRSKKFRYRFGPLNGVYGRNRLNVAISRARERIYVVASFDPSDLKYEGKFDGPKLLGKYLAYCKAVSEKDDQIALSILESLNEVKIAPAGLDEFDSDFEGEVRDALVKLGYQVKTQVGCQGYKIDLGVLHPKDKHRYIAGVECDGERYHSSKSAKDRDIYRQTILESGGWKILRVWSRDWWRDPDGEIRRLDRELKSIL